MMIAKILYKARYCQKNDKEGKEFGKISGKKGAGAFLFKKPIVFVHIDCGTVNAACAVSL